MTRHKAADALRRALRTFVQAAGGYLVVQTAWPQSSTGARR